MSREVRTLDSGKGYFLLDLYRRKGEKKIFFVRGMTWFYIWPLAAVSTVILHSSSDDGVQRTLVIYLSHTSSGAETPFYTPKVRGITFVHEWIPASGSGVSTPECIRPVMALDESEAAQQAISSSLWSLASLVLVFVLVPWVAWEATRLGFSRAVKTSLANQEGQCRRT